MNTGTNDLTRIARTGIDEAVRVLVDAFMEDPLMDYLFPEHRERPEDLSRFFRVNLEYAVMVGEVYAAPCMTGVSVWAFPRDAGRPVVSRQDDPRLSLEHIYDEATYQKINSLSRYFDRLHREMLKGSYFYLMFLGVIKAQQGKGIGSLLIRPLLDRADLKKLPCLLETMNVMDLAFYRKHGFEVMLEHVVCEGGPLTWTMLRKPRE